MPAVDISAQHSKHERPYFGLDAILDELLEHPLREHTIIARIVRSGLTVNDTKGTSTPRVRPLHIEVIVGTDEKEALAILERAYARRTGREYMPPDSLLADAAEPGDDQLDGQTTVAQQLAEAVQPAEQPDADPTAGPHGPEFSDGNQAELWPGDEGYEPGKR